MGVPNQKKALIVKTVDGGANWTVQLSGASQWLAGVHFADETTGWAVGANGTILHASPAP